MYLFLFFSLFVVFSFKLVYYSIRLACLHDSESSTTMTDKDPISVFTIINYVNYHWNLQKPYQLVRETRGRPKSLRAAAALVSIHYDVRVTAWNPFSFPYIDTVQPKQYITKTK